MKLKYSSTDINLLKNLYLIWSPSFHEDKISNFVQKRLDEIGIEYSTFNNQIYNVKKNTPMMCAHMDQVGTFSIDNVYVYENCIFGDGNLGADDKNGVWIILKVLEKFPDISFIFSTGEEAGCQVDKLLKIFPDELIDSIPYCLVFDRRNGSDIIGKWNDYCKEDLENDIVEIGRKFGYSKAHGTFSDCDMLSQVGIPCANLSCGYYNAHSDNEFTDIDELYNALEFAKALLNELKSEKYDRAENEPYKYHYYGHYGHWHHGNVAVGYDSDYDKYTNYGSSGGTRNLLLGTGEKDNTTDNTMIQLEFSDWGFIYKEEEPEKEVKFWCNSCSTSLLDRDILYENQCPNCGDFHSITIDDDAGNDDTGMYPSEVLYCGVCDEYVYDTDQIDNRCMDCGSMLESIARVSSEDSDESEVGENRRYYCTTCDEFVKNEDAGIGQSCRKCKGALLDIYY